ncbi:MAG TPA: iron-sulfur cluster carrier protein ApbC [Rhodanobacteraceae bacterium]
MSLITEERVREVLAGIIDPYTSESIKDTIRAVGVAGTNVSVDIALGYPAEGWRPTLAALVRETLTAEAGVVSASVSITCRVQAHRVQGKLLPLPGVKNVIAVASGKGGVGKSTVAVNLALGLAAEGATVGILDADIYGPSQPRMLGLTGKPASPDGKTIIPMIGHGLQAMSIGSLVGDDTPMAWRGPMVTQALMQLLGNTRWDSLDYLVIDMPPGTGDIHLTLAQKIPVSGGIIVTTPQDIALLDAQKGLQLFNKVGVTILGIVENMSTHICSNCGHEEHIFGEGGGQLMSDRYDVPLLGNLPLDIRIREQADGGNPTVAAEPESPLAMRYREIARKAAALLSLSARNEQVGFPTIKISND